jgi:hypothetical protein
MAKKQHAFDTVVKAIAEARARGIHIVRQPMFDWISLGGDRSLPRACDATGAVLIQMGYGKSEFTYSGRTDVYGTGEVRPKGWPLLVQNHLGVGVFWLWCFWMGWGYSNQMQVSVTNDNGDIVGWKDEEVSREAIKLAKKFCR